MGPGLVGILISDRKKIFIYSSLTSLSRMQPGETEVFCLRKDEPERESPRGAPGSEGAGRKELGWEEEEMEVMSCMI